MDDARFPWLVLLPRREETEIVDLLAAERQALLDEIVLVSAALRAVTACDKLNIGTLGNIVRQLHVHVVARFVGDPAWPGPVWGSGQRVAYAAAARDRMVTRIRAEFPASIPGP